MKLKNIQNPIFYFGAIFYLIISLLVSSFLPKGIETTFCYSFYGKGFDQIFVLLTHLGEFYLIIPLGIYILWKRRDFFFYALFIFISQFFVVHLLKRILDFPRPLLFYKDKINFTLLDGITPLYNQSMPSGHTALGFCTFYIISYLFPDKKNQWICLLLAIGVGLSRIYLLCHFYQDVLVGSLIAFVCSYLGVFFYERKFNQSVDNNS